MVEERNESSAQPGRRLVTATAVIGLIGLLISGLGLFWASRTVKTPLQDCGVAAAFLLEGRMNVYANPDEPPAGLTKADVQKNNDDPCQEVAANQARPGAIAIVAGLVVVAAAAFVEIIARWRWRVREQRAAAPSATLT